MFVCAYTGWLLSTIVVADAKALYEAELVFPLHPKHNHAPGLVECPNGDLLVSWYRGSGERQADDVAIYGARRRKGSRGWSEAFLMIDTPGFPDGNTCMMIDARQRLWIFWPVIVANTWESTLTHYRISSNYQGDASPKWDWQSAIFLKPPDLAGDLEKVWAAALEKTDSPTVQGHAKRIRTLAADKLSHRLGWQPRCKPTVLPTGRMLLPLYSDTFDCSIMAISDDGGTTWLPSRAIVGIGNIQPTVLRRNDGTLVAYMREAGITRRMRIAESSDDGLSWGEVGVTQFPNPGSGLDGLRLRNGHWLLVYNDTTKGRNSLVASLSEDEGGTWKHHRHLERHETGSYHYPAVIQSRDGMIHVVYSYFVAEGKSMKHAAFNEAWIRQGD
jgi:predicted neuraminidase